MQKIATLSCLLILSACSESEEESIFSGSSTLNNGRDTEVCNAISYAKQKNNTSGKDPLLAYQWHILNNSSPGLIKQDVNLQYSLWNEVTGSGIKVAVIDSSIDYNHPDLQSNLDLVNSCQFGTSPSGGHATSAAGLISSVKDNALGGSGVAPDSQIQGFNTLDVDPTVLNWETSLSTASSRNRDIDVFNMSLGYPVSTTPIPFDSNIESFIKQGTESGRGGLGALYFKAAGNNFDDARCSMYQYHSDFLPCQSSVLDPDNNIPYLMVVSALNAEGTRASYSSTGSNILFSAPGGGDGVGIITTNDINLATDMDDIEGYEGYTDEFTGTSAATPITSGISALILQANPNLGWRDVRDIMIRTADQVDASAPAVVIGNTDNAVNSSTASTTTVKLDWQDNAAGLSYHNDYGFGRINAVNAVERAKGYTTNLPALVSATSKNSSAETIADDISVPLSSRLSAPAGVTTVESVQIKLTLSHPYISDLMVKLTSPSGTESILLTPRNALNTEIQNYELTLLSQAFYGENAAGSWQLQIYDTHSDTYGTGSLHRWSMTVYGH